MSSTPVVCEFCRKELFDAKDYATLLVNKTTTKHHMGSEPVDQQVVFTWHYCDVSCLHADWTTDFKAVKQE